MPDYFYTAKSLEGEIKTGTLSAKDQSDLAKTLHQEGYFLISADTEETSKKKGLSFVIPFFDRVSLTEKMFFTRNLEVMVAAGVSLPRAIGTLASQVRSKKFKKALLAISDNVTKGETLSGSFKGYPTIFSELFQNMVKVGEETGNLEEILKNLGHQIEKEHELRSKVAGAMMYPAIIIFAMIVIATLMLIMVIPKLAETFEELNVELPLTTQLVISTGTFMSNNWIIFLIVLFLVIFGLKLFFNTKSGKRFRDKLLLKIPILSGIVKKTNAAYTVRSLSSLFSSGVPIVHALEIVSRALGNVHFQEAMLDVSQKVGKGAKLSESLKNHQNLYPATVVQMIEVGEETGETSDILKRLAEFYEEEVSNSTKNLSTIIEPVLMLLVGAAVGFFAVSMIQPMYSMLGSI